MVSEDDILAALPSLRRFAFRLCRGDADRGADLVQDTIVRALEKQHQFDGRNFRSWALRIMYTVFCGQYRRRVKFETRYDPGDFRDTLTEGPRQHDRLHLEQVAERVMRMLPKHRRAIGLIVGGDSYEEIAQKTGSNIGTVRSRLYRARELLEDYR